MRIFARMGLLAEFRERQMPFLETLEDEGIVRQIGLHQVLGAPLTLKQLLMLGFGSAATVQRRLQRLKRAGIVLESRSGDDRRLIELTLSPGCMKTFGKYEALLAGSQTDAAAAKGRPLKTPAHSCVLCDGDAAAREAAVRFLREGMRLGQTCILIGSRSFRDSALTELEASSGRRPSRDRVIVYGGGKSPDAVLDFLAPIFEEARAAGKTVRGVGNMTWARRYMDFDALMDYEARVDPLLRQFGAQAICQYDVRRFRGSELLRALRCHPDTSRYPLMLS
jgi:hypothetical protein